MRTVYQITGRVDVGSKNAIAEDAVVARDDQEYLILEETTVEEREA